MLDELDRIEECIDGFERQTYPLEQLEVLVVDGGSTDGSPDLVEKLMAERPWLRLVDNPDRRASAAFNRGIEASHGAVVCLVSAHGSVQPDFVSRSVAALGDTGAGGVGGKLEHDGDDPITRAIGLAMTSPFGMASPFRYANERREVDTIGHPAYWREVLDAVGPFDETLERNSDYELNHRVRDAGYALVFDPAIVTRYVPRSGLRALARQFWWYGKGKVDVLRRQPGSLKARHLVAPAATAGLAIAPVLLLSNLGRKVLATGGIAYGGLLVAALASSRPRRHGADPVTFVAAFPVMHVAWGVGVWTALTAHRP
jgi:glycosyltransferase involved in cell wall biosynthesis